VRRANVGGAGLEDVEDELPAVGQQSGGGAQGAPALVVAVQMHERPERRDHAIARRQLRRIPEIAEHGFEDDVVTARAALGLGEHRRRRVERDHAVAVPGELDRDAPAARAELDDGPGRALAGEQVERDVVIDAGAPAVVERPEPLVGLAARYCCHTR
jgi:hypothetical protein